MKKKGMTVEKQWLAYISTDSKGYARTQFYKYLMEYQRRRGITMHIEHKAGEAVYIDFAGDKLKVIDRQTGELLDAEVFVAILGYSQLIYVEACLSQKTEDVLPCCRRSFEYFGGVPRSVVPDNMKTLVTKSSKYEPVINETFAAFAEHYSTVVLPARAYKPRDKALVENAVGQIYRRIYTELGSGCMDLDELNKSIRAALDNLNKAPLKAAESRREIFEQEERETLTPLPSVPFEMRTIREVKVMKNGHVALHQDRHYYSVPYTLIGKAVKLVYDSQTVEVFYQHKPVARHTRNYRKNRYTTDKEHMASQHRFVAEWSPEFFIGKAREISEEVVLFVERLMESKQHPEQGYKACSGVLYLARKVGPTRITNACRRAISFETYHYAVLKEILAKGLDKVVDPTEEPLEKHTPVHHNLRGKAYYQQQSLTLKNQQP
jgi:transposase